MMYTLIGGGMVVDHRTVDAAIADARELGLSAFEIVDEDSGEQAYVEYPAPVWV